MKPPYAVRLLLSLGSLVVASLLAPSVRAASISTRSAPAVSLVAQVASSDLAVGRNRFTLGLLDNNHPVEVGQVQLQFFYDRKGVAVAMGRATARFNNFYRGLPNTAANAAALAIKGVYVAYPTFAQAGDWGVEVRIRYKGQVRAVDTGFSVTPHSSAPAVGTPAPRSHNPTVKQMPVSKLDSGNPPDDMHKLSIAQAIAEHKPLIVLFSSPGFCESRMCGPETQIVASLEPRYRGRVNFIHIEVYKNAYPGDGYAPTVLQWHLKSEPWVFVINRRGIIAARFEGPTSAGEIETALAGVLK